MKGGQVDGLSRRNNQPVVELIPSEKVMGAGGWLVVVVVRRANSRLFIATSDKKI